jgi:hypothetical protein
MAALSVEAARRAGVDQLCAPARRERRDGVVGAAGVVSAGDDDGRPWQRRAGQGPARPRDPFETGLIGRRDEEGAAHVRGPERECGARDRRGAEPVADEQRRPRRPQRSVGDRVRPGLPVRGARVGGRDQARRRELGEPSA